MFVGGQAAWSPWPRGSWVCLGTAPGSPCQHFPGLCIAASPGVSLPGCPHPTTAPSHACPVKPMQPTPKPRTGPSPCLGSAATSSWGDWACRAWAVLVPGCSWPGSGCHSTLAGAWEGWGQRWPCLPGRSGRMMLRRQFPWQQQRGPSAARCGLQEDPPLASPCWRHPQVSPPGVLLPPARDTVVPSRVPQGDRDPSHRHPACTKPRGWPPQHGAAGLCMAVPPLLLGWGGFRVPGSHPRWGEHWWELQHPMALHQGSQTPPCTPALAAWAS